MDIVNNKNKFIELLKTNIKREGVASLIKYLEMSDFFTAPASTRYHNNTDGGLCDHSLGVFNWAINILKAKYGSVEQSPWSLETITIVTLLHDLAKVNFYETFEKNVNDPNHPQANDRGWYKEKSWKVRDKKDRFIFGTHGQNSMVIVEQYLGLSKEESIAILWHMGGKEEGCSNENGVVSEVLSTYPLTVIVHTADMLTSNIDEKVY